MYVNMFYAMYNVCCIIPIRKTDKPEFTRKTVFIIYFSFFSFFNVSVFFVFIRYQKFQLHTDDFLFQLPMIWLCLFFERLLLYFLHNALTHRHNCWCRYNIFYVFFYECQFLVYHVYVTIFLGCCCCLKLNTLQCCWWCCFLVFISTPFVFLFLLYVIIFFTELFPPSLCKLINVFVILFVLLSLPTSFYIENIYTNTTDTLVPRKEYIIIRGITKKISFFI